MAGVVINVTISRGGPSSDDILEDSLSDSGFELYVIHGPGACGPCRANQDPRNVPCEQCNGNILRLLTESNDEDPIEDLAEAGLSGGGNMCQCRVGVRRKGDRTFD